MYWSYKSHTNWKYLFHRQAAGLAGFVPGYGILNSIESGWLLAKSIANNEDYSKTAKWLINSAKNTMSSISPFTMGENN